MNKVLRIGSRESPLAVAQAREAIQHIAAAHDCEIQLITATTIGDRTMCPFSQLNQENIFTKEIEEMLLEGKIDVAVHSLKDVPVVEHPELELAAVFQQHDCRDALISVAGYPSIANLPQGCRVGTASARRRAQLLRLRPDLAIVNLRGNIVTRLEKLQTRQDDIEAIVLAVAGLERLGIADFVPIPVTDMLPSAGQGVLAAQVRSSDDTTKEMMAAVNHKSTWLRCMAERHFLRLVGVGCGDPVAALATVDPQAQIEGHFMLLSRDGSAHYHAQSSGPDPYQVAAAAAEELKRYIPEVWL